MPRWFTRTLVVMACGLLWLIAHKQSAPLAATTTSMGAEAACSALMVPQALDDAVQTEQSAAPFRMGNATITPLAAFSVAGRILAKESYTFDKGAKYAPIDLALGWGPMAKPGLADRLHVWQAGRWYRYRWGNEGPPMSPSDIATHSANMHMVPADAAAASALKHARAGELVRVDGWLVSISGDDGFQWRSSLTRSDVGAGACELILVCTVRPH
jgi:hypothetical protein